MKEEEVTDTEQAQRLTCILGFNHKNLSVRLDSFCLGGAGTQQG